MKRSTMSYLVALMLLSTLGSEKYGAVPITNKTTTKALNQCDGKPKDITATSGILTSPKHPSLYSHNMFCVWRITVPRGTILKLTFVSFHLESNSKCRYDYVKLQNGLTFGSPFLGKHCGSNLPPTRYANSGSMLLTFKSDHSVSYTGFKAVFTSVSSTYSGCSSTPLEITRAKGNIKSPNYPSEYSDNLNCTWRITSPEGMRLNLTFDSFQLESSSTCKYDYVVLRNGSSLPGKFCGKTVPSVIIADSGTIQVTFVSDGSVRKSGFLASYSAVPLGSEACNGSPKEITASNGVLTSPNFPYNYNSNQRCVWKLKVPDGKVVQLAFTSFALEGLFCSDHVEIRSGWTNTSSLLGKFCGHSTPPTLYTDGRTMMVTFSSDGSVSFQGFHAVFTAVSGLNKCLHSNGGCDQICVTVPGSYYCSCKKGYQLNADRRSCRDNEPPLVDFCPNDKLIITRTQKTNVSWTEPKFTDNSGKFRLERNRAPGEMTLGKHSIIYIATDESGNSATCKFTLSVQPNDCPILDPPINGYIACDTWLLGKFCTIHCDERFEFSQKPVPLYVCGGSGKWAPPGSTPFPDCSKLYNPKVARVGIKTAQYSKGDCNNKTVQTEMKKKFIEIFSKSLYGRLGGCTGNKQCKVENVIVRCGKMNLTILAGNGNRKKRDVEYFQSKFAYFATRRSEQNDEELRSSGSGKERKRLNNIMPKQDKDVEDVLQNNRSDLRCKRGHFLQNGSNCVRCPVGTYQPIGREGCLQCPRGYFSSKEAQVSCTKCPSDKTTNSTGAKTESYCLSPCKPGFYSATGLEPCVSCPEGHFQNESGRTSCKQCPEKTTTSKRGAVHIQGCQGG